MSRARVLVAAGVLGFASVLVLPIAVLVLTTLGGVSEDGAGCADSSIVLASNRSSIELTQVQRDNAAVVVSVGRSLGVPDRGVVIALAVAHQESRFLNYANDGKGGDIDESQLGIEESLALPHDAVGSDHGSLGIFQQQWPWWGSMQELMTPALAAQKFYERLVRVPRWQELSVTEAGQAVQKSAHPDAYADDEGIAVALLQGTTGSLDSVSFSDGSCASSANYSGSVVHPIPAGVSFVDRRNFGQSGPRWSSRHTGTDFSTPCGTSVLASTGGTVIVETDQAWAGRWLVKVSAGPGALTTWYAHMESVTVVDGQQVQAGMPMGAVGREGNASGCHLHFEVHPQGGSIYEDPVDPSLWLEENLGTTQQVSTTSMTGQPATLMTANVPWTISPQRAGEQVRALLASGPDVLVLQEVRELDVAALAASSPGSWQAWQGEGPGQAAGAIVWNRSKLTLAARGIALGFDGREYDRWIQWVVLRSSEGALLPVVGMHMPPDPTESQEMLGYYRTMTASYLNVVEQLSSAGYPPLVGADWNAPLDRPRDPWGPVATLNGIGFATNWQSGSPCPGTTGGGARIDGWAYSPRAFRLVDHGCLPFGSSDHRPVWVSVRPVLESDGS